MRFLLFFLLATPFLAQNTKQANFLNSPNQVEHAESTGEVNTSSQDADYIFDGDIILSRKQANALLAGENTYRQKRQAMNIDNTKHHLWGRNISYIYAENYPEEWKAFIKYAANLYSRLTCLKIGEYGRHYVRHRLREYYELVNPKFQLKTEVGSQPKRPFPPNHIKSIQELNMESPIADALFEGDIMLTRPGTNNGANKPLIAMEAVDELYQWTMGGPFLSFYDVLLINKMYSCIDNCASTTTLCLNGGYPNPNNCSICNCPSGYGGVLCDKVPENGTKILLGPRGVNCQSGEEQGELITGLESTVYVKKHYWVKVLGKNKKIRITYHPSAKPYYFGDSGCTIHGMEVKVQEDQKLTGYRFCSKEITYVTSNSSFVPIIIYHRKDYSMKYSFCVESVDEQADEQEITQSTLINAQTTTTVGQPIKTTTTGQPIISLTEQTTVEDEQSIELKHSMHQETTTTVWKPTTSTKAAELPLATKNATQSITTTP